MWPFRRKPVSTRPLDLRVWNEDWQIGDTAECVCDRWGEKTRPWDRPKIGARFTVVGFSEGADVEGCLRYFLRLEGWPVALTTTAFRKVRPVASENSEIVKRILTAKPGADNKRTKPVKQPVADHTETLKALTAQTPASVSFRGGYVQAPAPVSVMELTIPHASRGTR